MDDEVPLFLWKKRGLFFVVLFGVFVVCNVMSFQNVDVYPDLIYEMT